MKKKIIHWQTLRSPCKLFTHLQTIYTLYNSTFLFVANGKYLLLKNFIQKDWIKNNANTNIFHGSNSALTPTKTQMKKEITSLSVGHYENPITL